jgi:polysaccharide biosynthesis transport protein
MTFGQFLAIFRARLWVGLLVLLVAVLGGLGVSLMLPKQYTATASVVVDFKPDPVSAVVYGMSMSPAFIATQVDIIRSDRVAQRVVRNLKLGENAQVRQQWLAETAGEGSIETWMADSFQRNMDVQPSRESSIIAVSYRAPDPRFAAALANAFVQAYIETALELRVDPARQYSTFFETRAAEARDALEKAQGKVSAFQKTNGIIATDERLDVENARLNELSSQLTQLQAISAESASRQAQAQGAQADKLQEVLNNSIVSQLKADINRAEARLQELSTRLGDAHPQVVEARASLQEQRTRLESETRRVTGSVGVANSINRAREAEVRRSLEEQRAKVLRMKAVRDDGLVLLRDADNAQRAYDAVLQRFTQTSLEGQTTQSNVNVMTQAVAPLKPSSPRIVLNTALALFVGLLLAIASMLIIELMDRRMRDSDDVLVSLGLPLLGVMPGPKSRLSGRLALAQQRAQRRLVGATDAPRLAQSL